MVKLTPEAVNHVALLARLHLEPGEVDRYARDLDAILGYAAKLDELDTTGIAPTSHSLPLANVFREDIPVPSLTPDQALANAPKSEDQCFRVPAVLQESGGA